MALPRVVRLGGVVTFTLVETAALALWLGIVDGGVAPEVPAVVGLGVLFVGLVVEGGLTYVTVNGLSVPDVGTLLGISASETALWAAWLFAADLVGGLVGVAAASAGLFVLLVPQHTVEDGVLRGERPLADVLDVGTLGFSFVEAAAAAIWLSLVRIDAGTLSLVGGDGTLSLVGSDGTLTTASVVLPARTEFHVVVELPTRLDAGAIVGVAALAILLSVEHVLAVDFARR